LEVAISEEDVGAAEVRVQEVVEVRVEVEEEADQIL
jgi:hypothetical protein